MQSDIQEYSLAFLNKSNTEDFRFYSGLFLVRKAHLCRSAITILVIRE